MIEKDQYDEEQKMFHSVVSAATVISQGAAGRPSPSSRHYWASVLFTRLCNNGVSLLYMTPRNRLVKVKIDIWNFAAIASLSRNLIDCYLAFYYLCVDKVTDDEWICRWNIFNLHDCSRRRKMLECFGATESELKCFDDQTEELRDRLLKNSYFRSLDKKVQKDYLRAKSAYLLTQDDLMKRIGLDIGSFRGLYIFLSSQTHSFPLGFYRTGVDNRGRGLENRVEKNYICSMFSISSFFVRRATNEMVDLFPNSDCNLSTIERKSIFQSKENEVAPTATKRKV
ncbi:MAG: DUF5677 domain-containing protein [Nitrospiria bacterium]